MRNEFLHAYSLHQRPYQEKRSIYYLLTQEYGIVHGVAKKGIPQFVPLTLFATGKRALKSLQQVNIADSVPCLQGQQQFVALYINEITLKLLPIEDSVPHIYATYSTVMSQLQQPLTGYELRVVLRHYEHVLFNDLGFAIDLEQDSEQNLIEANLYYIFAADAGWIKQKSLSGLDKSTAQRSAQNGMQPELILGKDIIDMREGINETTIKNWSIVHRELIDRLFDYRPLQSRILWQQYHRYQ